VPEHQAEQLVLGFAEQLAGNRTQIEQEELEPAHHLPYQHLHHQNLAQTTKKHTIKRLTLFFS